MKRYIKKIISISIIALILLQGMEGVNVSAAGTKVEYLGQAQYGPYIVGKFRVNGGIAFCLEHYKQSPGTGASYSAGSVYSNKKVKAILYYGAGGPEDEVGMSDTGIVATSLALDSVINGNHAEGRNRVPGYEKLMNHAEQEDAPSDIMNFSKTNVKSSVSGNVQKSESILFNADPKNSITLKVPNKVSIHVGNKKYNSGSVKIKGGQSFYFTADLSYGEDVIYKNLKPNFGKYQSLAFIPGNSNMQKLGMMVAVDPEPMTNLKVNFEVRQKKIVVEHRDNYNNNLLEKDSYTRNIGSKYSFGPESSIKKGTNTFVPVSKSKKSGILGNENITLKFFYDLQRTIKINHIDARDGRLIKTEKEIKVRGEAYSYAPRDDLKKGNYTYRPVSTKKKSGTVGGSNITLNFYYDVPLIKAGLEKIQIYTAPSSEGIPVIIDIKKDNIYPYSIDDMTKEKINVNLYQNDKEIISKTYTAKNLPTSLKLTVPSNHLKVNAHHPYTIKFEGYNKNAFDIPKDELSITTDGYTSAERTLKVNANEDTELGYKGVVKTEREVKKDMKVFYENIHIPVKKVDKLRTGYGFFMPLNLTYQNDISNANTDFSFNMYVPKEIVDDSYIKYDLKESVASVPLELTVEKNKKEKDSTTSRQFHELQHINVEKNTGYLFSDEQVENNDKRIKYELIDGKRKFYIPIWGEIGDYPVSLESVQSMGINRIDVKINYNIDVFAHMYAHIDSETLEDDAILFKPVNKQDPFPNGLPNGWTQSDIEWIKN